MVRTMTTTSWRAPATTMLAVLTTWFSAWRIEVAAGLHVDVVILATVLALTLARVLGRERPQAASPYLLRIVALPVIALAATEVGRLLARHEVIGGAAFIVVLAGAIWIRRYGAGWARLGTIVTLPFVALLVVPVPVDPQTARSWWPALFALLAFAWALGWHLLAWRTGFLPKPRAPRHVHRLSPSTSRATGRATSRPTGRLPASTRMALQLGVGLGASYALGRWLFPEHWPWLVLSCYVVCSGNRGRGDVLHKGLLRLVGALAGTVVATLVAGQIPAGDRWMIVLLFVVMAAALWARQRSYAFWAAGVTAMLALLHGYAGIGGAGELGQRMAGVALGSVLGVLASWFVLPVRSRDAFRKRRGEALRALKELRDALRSDDVGEAAAAEQLARAEHRFDLAVEQLVALEPLWRLHARVRPRQTVELGEPARLIARLVELRAALGVLPAKEAAERCTAVLRHATGGAEMSGVVQPSRPPAAS